MLRHAKNTVGPSQPVVQCFEIHKERRPGQNLLKVRQLCLGFDI